jgi:membrane fusion protein (multidrug efflux system)
MKRAKNYIILLISIITLVVVKIYFFPFEKGKASSVDKQGKKPALPVSVFVVGNEKLQNKIFSNGKILANEEAELRIEANGRITYLNLPEGKFVSSGTLLLKLNDAEQKTQLAKIEAQLKLASSTETRRKQLLEINGISKEEYESSLSSLLSLKADSAYIRTQIAKTELYAPFSGVIGIRNVSPGSYITPSIIVASIHQVDPVKVEFSMPERYSLLFKVGDEITFIKEGSDKTFHARITVQDPLVDQANGNVRYRALAKNSTGELLPGSFARIEFLLKEEDNKAVFVPTEAIVPVAKGKKVFVVEDGVAKERFVDTGIRTENFLQIFSGLHPGDSVVIKGNFQLKDNSPVKVGKPKTNKAA